MIERGGSRDPPFSLQVTVTVCVTSRNTSYSNSPSGHTSRHGFCVTYGHDYRISFRWYGRPRSTGRRLGEPIRLMLAKPTFIVMVSPKLSVLKGKNHENLPGHSGWRVRNTTLAAVARSVAQAIASPGVGQNDVAGNRLTPGRHAALDAAPGGVRQRAPLSGCRATARNRRDALRHRAGTRRTQYRAGRCGGGAFPAQGRQGCGHAGAAGRPRHYRRAGLPRGDPARRGGGGMQHAGDLRHRAIVRRDRLRLHQARRTDGGARRLFQGRAVRRETGPCHG